MAKIGIPCINRLHELFYYNEDEGLLIRKVTTSPTSREGTIAGSRNQRYRIVFIDGRSYVQHRVIWKMVYNEEPEEIDHINRDGFDNRLTNLRKADRSLNCINQKVRTDNKYGRNIHKSKRGKFIVQIQRDKKRLHITCDTLEHAIDVRNKILSG